MTSDVSARSATAPSDMTEILYESGWSDGLPLVPPYVERVQEFVEASGRSAEDSLGSMPPNNGDVTIEKIATNAVMAGCLPQHMPAVVASVEASLDPRFNLRALLATTHPSATMVMINGPASEDLGFTGGSSAMGPGNRANATVGRALQLVFRNVGGSLPGVTDKATLGNPAKYSFCFAENEAESPWAPFHVEQGFAPEDNAVTVYAAEGPHNLTNQVPREPMSFLKGIASLMANLGSNQIYSMGDHFVALAPEHAAVIAAARWKKSDIQHYLFEHARLRMGDVMLGGWFGERTERYTLWPKWVDHTDPEASLPVCREPGDIKVVVVGGPGKHSAYLPGLGSRCITRAFVPAS